MSLLNILFGVQLAKIGAVSIDASVREVHDSDCTATDNPVEEGADVTDHVTIEPKRLSIEGVITDTPISFGVVSAVEGAVRTVGRLFGMGTRSKNAYDKLVALQATRKPFTVVTGLKVYKNMILEKLSVPRTCDTGNSIHFTANMKEIIIARSQTSSGSGNASADVASLASGTQDLGSVATASVTDQVAAAGAEASQGWNGLFDKFEGIRNFI